MQWRAMTVAALVGTTLSLAATGASATAMHTEFGAHLSGMGEHGTVNLHVSSGKLCWAFDIPSVKAPTRATIHTGASGPVLLELGMHYTKSGCAKESMMTLEHLEAKPGAYSAWVDTKAHPGEVRGVLVSGMVSM
ncbi:MAG TPA: CHRD domain-containing protein [Solirubrobacteraceae bacterium]